MFPVIDLPFASYTFNLGDHSTCKAHIDGSNLVTGLCLAIPLGNFDHSKGGHLILHELQMVLELPSGSIVLFPSGMITHENTNIQPHEERQAFTAFSSSSLFQWVDNGFDAVPKCLSQDQRIALGHKVWASRRSRLPHIFKYF